MWAPMTKPPHTTSLFPPRLNSSSPKPALLFILPFSVFLSFWRHPPQSYRWLIWEPPSLTSRPVTKLQYLLPLPAPFSPGGPCLTGGLTSRCLLVLSTCWPASGFCFQVLPHSILDSWDCQRNAKNSSFSLHHSPASRPSMSLQDGDHVLDRAHTPLWLGRVCLPCPHPLGSVRNYMPLGVWLNMTRVTSHPFLSNDYLTF